MIKNIFSGLIGCLVGIVIMGIIVFMLQTKDRLDLMPIIMLVCILLLIAIGLLTYWWIRYRHRPVQIKAKK